MPNIRSKQGRLIREQTFFPERGHRELKLVDGQSENVARLPVMAYDQCANIRLPAHRKVGANFSRISAICSAKTWKPESDR